MTKDEFYRAVVGEVLRTGATDEEMLACMIVLHACSLTLADDLALSDAGAERILCALTRRHSAEIISSVLPARFEAKGSAEFWCSRYEEQTPFEVVEDIAGPWKEKFEQAVEAIKRTGLVREVAPES